MAQVLMGILVGMGGRAHHWYGAVERHPQTEWVAYVEPVEGNREAAISRWSLPRERVFERLEDALGKTQADFVMDVTPPGVHEAVARAAFGAGLHVLGEKPMSDDYQAARRMVEAGARAGVRHMITQNYRFGPQPRTSRRLLAEGLVGEPGLVDILFTMPWADSPGSHYVRDPFIFTRSTKWELGSRAQQTVPPRPNTLRCYQYPKAFPLLTISEEATVGK